MIPLIDRRDSEVLEKVDNLKNAVLYKDMFAFYDAYSAFLSMGIENLPNYCLINNKLYLNGLCLLIKDYSSEFDFETLDLTLDYLKILYYTLAKFSKDGYLPDKSKIIEEFDDRKNSSDDLLEKSVIYCEKLKETYNDTNNRFEQQEIIHNKKVSKLKTLSLHLILLVIMGAFVSALSIVLGFAKVINLVVGILVAVVIFALSVFLLIFGRKKKIKLKQEVERNEVAIEELRVAKDNARDAYKKAAHKSNMLNVEVYNYIDCYDKIQEMTAEFDNDLLQKAVKYNMLSYNLKYDILEAFDEHNKDILGMVDKLKSMKYKKNVADELSKIYDEIQKKDWLYNNNYVRYSFISKIIDFAGKSHQWQIMDIGKLVDPFGISAKEIAEEKVAYLQDEKSLFVAMPINRLLKTNIVMQDSELKFSKNLKVMDLKRLKINYSNKFYDYKEISKLNNVFYNKHNKGVDIEAVKSKKQLPQLIELKLKILESELKCENSHHNIVSATIENYINSHEELIYEEDVNSGYEYGETDYDIGNLEDYVDIPFDALHDVDEIESIEEIDDLKVKYKYKGQTIIGFKF